MTPLPFPQANVTLTKPEGATDEQCTSLPAFRDGTHVISCWQPTAEDLAALIEGKPVWLWVWGGVTQPPVALTTEDPFAPRTDA